MQLVIDTATASCSVALIEGQTVVAAEHDRVGRGHAEKLIPMIGALLNGGKAGSILVNCGPGSFTGLRVGLAAARALSFGWGVPAQGYSSHALIAAIYAARHRSSDQMCVITEGGHGEFYVQSFAANPLHQIAEAVSLPPEEAVAQAIDAVILTSCAERLFPFLSGQEVHAVEPGAADAVLLPESMKFEGLNPIYVRAPDAKLPQS